MSNQLQKECRKVTNNRDFAGVWDNLKGLNMQLGQTQL